MSFKIVISNIDAQRMDFFPSHPALLLWTCSPWMQSWTTLEPWLFLSFRHSIGLASFVHEFNKNLTNHHKNLILLHILFCTGPRKRNPSGWAGRKPARPFVRDWLEGTCKTEMLSLSKRTCVGFVAICFFFCALGFCEKRYGKVEVCRKDCSLLVCMYI